MAQVLINVGTTENDGTGDGIQLAGQKINDNFDELYAKPSVLSSIRFEGNKLISNISNADIVFEPSGTGSVIMANLRFNDNNIESINSNDDLNIIPSGVGGVKVAGIRVSTNEIQTWRSNDDIIFTPSGTGQVAFGNIEFKGTTLSSADSSSININEGLIVDGTANISGAASLADIDAQLTLAVTTAATTLSSTLSVAGATTLTTTNIDNINIYDNYITSDSNADINIQAGGTGNVIVGGITFAGTTLSAADSSTININDNLIVDGTTNVSGATTFSGAVSLDLTTLGVTGLTTVTNISTTSVAFGDGITVDNLTFNDNTISTSSNADLNLTPSGNGTVNITSLTVDSSIKLFDNTIQTIQSNADIILSGGGTGSVATSNIDMNSGTIDNVVIGAATPAAGTFTTLTFSPTASGSLTTTGLTITDNDITSTQSNDNLEFSANGSGYVYFNGFRLPNADGDTGTLLLTDASKNLSWGSSGIILEHSDIQDARVSVGFASITEINANTAFGQHESITGSSSSVIDEWTQAKYDSTWYLALTRMLSADSTVEYATQKWVVAQGTQDGSSAFEAFSGAGNITRTGDTEYFDGSTRTGQDRHIEISTDVTGGKVRLLGLGGILADGSTRSSINAVSYYRIGLGDNDSSVTDGKTTTIVHADLDSGTAAVDTWAHADYRGAKYFISINNTTSNEISNSEVLVVHNGSDAFIVEYNAISSNSSNTPLATFTADIDGSNVRLLGSNGTAGTCRITMYRVLLADDESDSTGTYVNVIGEVEVTNTAKTTIDTNTFRGSATPDMSSQKTISSFTNTDFDSVWYHAITKDSTNSEWGMNKLSLTHGTTSDGSTKDAYITDSGDIRTNDHQPLTTFDANISGSTVQLLGTAHNDGSTTIENAITYYGIGLGDSTTTATSGKISTHAGVTVGGTTETTIDHVVASGTVTSLLASERTVASFTASQFNGALYHIVTRDLNGTSFEIQKISVLQNFTDAYLTSSSVVQTDPADQHPTFDADITATSDSTATVRLRATDSDGSSTPSNTMAYYRIGIGDDDSTGYVGELGLVHDIMHTSIIDSTVTNLDTWTHASHCGAKYFINVKNQSTGETSNIEALVTHDNTNAYITSYNEHFSGNNSLITLTADISGTSVRLRGSATAGGSTKVIVNRIVAFGDSESDEATTDSTRKVIGNVIASSTATEFDTFQSSDTDAVHYVITGQGGTNENYICEADVVTDGTGVFVSQGPSISTKGTGPNHDLLVITATISGGTVSVKAASTSGATAVQAYAVRLKAPTEQIVDIDSWAHGSSRGAKYYIAIKETDSGYVSNLECLVTHNGSDAFITIYNEHYSNETIGSMVTLTADISGTDVRLRGLASTSNLKIKFYKIMLGDSESNASGTDANVIGAVTISSASTAIDTFVDTAYTGAHYILVGWNSGESAASICEATVLTDGTTAFINQGPIISSKETDQVLLTAAHDGSSTVTLSGTSSSGGSTTVNAYRIHMLRGDGTAYDQIDEFASADYQGAHYVIVGKNASNESQILELTAVTDGVGAYITETGPNISTHSTTTPLMNFTAVYDESKLKLRAENSQDGTTTTVNAWRVHLAREDGDTSGIKTLDTWDASTYRSAKYTVSVSDSSNGRYETLDLNVTHDGSNAYLATFGNVTNHTSTLITFTASIVSGEVTLKGQISNTDTHEVTVIRRVIES